PEFDLAFIPEIPTVAHHTVLRGPGSREVGGLNTAGDGRQKRPDGNLLPLFSETLQVRRIRPDQIRAEPHDIEDDRAVKRLMVRVVRHDSGSFDEALPDQSQGEGAEGEQEKFGGSALMEQNESVQQ
ncbi:MAG: hypothetical protein JWQ08_2206, partial [Deinococcus sp.]|nr:hypothetical protein [Deinococcus sp.]